MHLELDRAEIPNHLLRFFAPVPALKAKNALGMPWRLAFALQDDGWILRSDVIWSKPNPMPESVRDRPTKSHEYLFLLAKRSRYFYDANAVAEETTEQYAGSGRRCRPDKVLGAGFEIRGGLHVQSGRPTRNKRTVWTICPKSFREAHFATFPPALVEPCILAGTSAAGECPHCGAAWERVVERGASSWEARKAAGHDPRGYHVGDTTSHIAGNPCVAALAPAGLRTSGLGGVAPSQTLVWRKTCSCPRHEPIPQTVLDPFSGAATTGLVALQHGRHYIGLELQESYLEMSARRLSAASPQKKAA